jgi:hypothetical protein
MAVFFEVHVRFGAYDGVARFARTMAHCTDYRQVDYRL